MMGAMVTGLLFSSLFRSGALTFLVACAHVHPTNATPDSPTVRRQPRDMTAAATKTIVVIDDERTIQATLTAILARNNYAVHVAANASQGQKKGR